jgi:hypothetical protein
VGTREENETAKKMRGVLEIAVRNILLLKVPGYNGEEAKRGRELVYLRGPVIFWVRMMPVLSGQRDFCVEANLLQARRQLNHKVGSLGEGMSYSGARARRVHEGVDKGMDATSVSSKPAPCRACMYLYQNNEIDHFVR